MSLAYNEDNGGNFILTLPDKSGSSIFPIEEVPAYIAAYQRLKEDGLLCRSNFLQ